jgi:hypothetical protein
MMISNILFRDVIIENCRRLLSFFKDNDKYGDHMLIADKDVSYAGLLKMYGILLDLYGAPRSFMSRLCIPGQHYDDFVDYAAKLENFKVVSWPDVVAVSFDYEGYNWVVEKK